MPAARVGDDDFAEFVAARYPALIRAAVLLGCGDVAEDATQDALVRCYVSWSRVQEADDREAYVYRVLVNGIRRARRRRWTGETPTEELPETGVAPDPAAEVALRESVLAALGRLSPGRRDVVVLRYYADLSERQVASVLGIPPGTAKSRAARGLADLKADPALSGLVPTDHALHKED